VYNKLLYLLLEGKKSRIAKMLVSKRDLRQAAKMRYKDFLDHFSNRGKLHWHGTEKRFKTFSAKKAGGAVHFGTRKAANYRAFKFWDDEPSNSEERKNFYRQWHKKKLDNYPGDVQNRTFTNFPRLVPALIQNKGRRKHFGGKAYNSDREANWFLHQSGLTGKYRSNAHRGDPKRRVKVVSYINKAEDPGHTTLAVTDPRNAWTYRRIIRLFGDKTRSMKTGQVLPKYKGGV